MVGFGDIELHELEYVSTMIQPDQMLITFHRGLCHGFQPHGFDRDNMQPGIDVIANNAAFATVRGKIYHIPRDHEVNIYGYKEYNVTTFGNVNVTILFRESLRQMMHEMSKK